MTKNQEKVLQMLKSNKKGVTGEDFPKRFSYSSRIAELRKKGFNIITIMEQCADVKVARYFLRGAHD